MNGELFYSLKEAQIVIEQWRPQTNRVLLAPRSWRALSWASDPSNELIHLYEIPDALEKKFRGVNKARSKLGISGSRWSRLGQLANDAPLIQGRHRGQNVGQLRDATDAELAEARNIAGEMIRKYLEYLP